MGPLAYQGNSRRTRVCGCGRRVAHGRRAAKRAAEHDNPAAWHAWGMRGEAGNPGGRHRRE
ncbi:hypothetical protein BLA18110_03708 [Burkholderia lata]|nr:hypothetical protein BLA18110_03708 [Burkholderia lata]